MSVIGSHGYDFRPGPWAPRALTPDEREAVTDALAALDATMQPAGPEHVEKCLVFLAQLVAKPSDMTPADAKAKLRAYAGQLSGYPADAVSAACQEHARKSKWFPTLAELVQPIEARLAEQTKARTRMVALLEYRPRVGQARIGELVRMVARHEEEAV